MGYNSHGETPFDPFRKATEMSRQNTSAGMPIRLTLEPGTYFRCVCGRSQNLPFCDGGHSGTEHPLRFEITERREVYICSCGKSAQQPFCDESCGVTLP
ncbi:MAG: CDGSH iron-sulfur domain-containing protein [Desulfuromonadales bacterium]|nr:CDGSH iron-sulfur domain-containing protein [Desulfuromonadales bacterium]